MCECARLLVLYMYLYVQYIVQVRKLHVIVWALVVLSILLISFLEVWVSSVSDKQSVVCEVAWGLCTPHKPTYKQYGHIRRPTKEGEGKKGLQIEREGESEEPGD